MAERLPPSRHCKFALASPLEVSKDVVDNRHAGIVSTNSLDILDLVLKKHTFRQRTARRQSNPRIRRPSERDLPHHKVGVRFASHIFAIFHSICIVNRNGDHGRVREAFEESLAKLGVEYIDLYLLHWPQAVISPTGGFSGMIYVLRLLLEYMNSLGRCGIRRSYPSTRRESHLCRDLERDGEAARHW